MGRHRRSATRTGTPVRTGLLGASAAVALGAAAVASGLLPGGDVFTVSGESSPGPEVRTGADKRLQTQGAKSADPTPLKPSAAPAPAHAPSTSPSPKASDKAPATPSQKKRTAEPKAAPEQKAKATSPERAKARESDRSAERPAPARTQPTPAAPSAPAARVEAEVLALVNEERAKVGCSPVRFDASLAKLAGDFSTDMATRGFFSHTDPDGDSPWDRAEQAGVKHLGGENIARGQADAAAVMNSWMNSEGHRANILNCDYKTLGVGVDLRDGGPWWTQNFGF